MDYERAKSITSQLPDFNAFFENTIDVKDSEYYKKYIRDGGLILENGDILTAETAPKRMHTKLQLNSSHNKDKLNKFKTILEELENERVVVFYKYRSCFNELNEICKKLKRPVSYINGDGKNLKNYEEKSNTVVLCQWQSGSTGQDLQLAKNSVCFSITDNAEFFDQHYARIKRIGQTEICTYTFLLTPLEKKMYNVLKTGQDFSIELYKLWESDNNA